MLFEKFGNQKLQISKLITLVLRERNDIVDLCLNDIRLMQVLSFFVAGDAYKLMLLLIIVRDLFLMRVTFKSNMVLLSFLIIFLIEFEHCHLHLNYIGSQLVGRVALWALARNVLRLLSRLLPEEYTCHTECMTAVQGHWKLSLCVKSALAADTFILSWHY